MMASKKDEFFEQKGCSGKVKYETIYAAYEAAVYLEQEHRNKSQGIYLNIYPCKKCEKWHLTSKDAYTPITERKVEIFDKYKKVPYDVSTDKDNERSLENDYELDDSLTCKPQQKENQTKPIEKPIEKVEPTDGLKLTISGTIDDIRDIISKEKIFGKIGENTFISSWIKKNGFDGVLNQITVFVANKDNNKLKSSYTILVKKDLIESNKKSKRNNIELCIEGIKLIDKKFWRCNKISK
jgi:hypothetical protein